MDKFENALAELSNLARAVDPPVDATVDRIVAEYLATFTGNKPLERERLGNAFQEHFPRRSERTLAIYRRIKRID